MNGATRSGAGWRMTLPEKGEPVVSIWAYTPDDAERMAHLENMRHYEAMADYEARLAKEAEQQVVAEFRRIRARA